MGTYEWALGGSSYMDTRSKVRSRKSSEIGESGEKMQAVERDGREKERWI